MNQNKTLKITASSFETLRLSLFRAACAMLTLAGSAACAAETISVRVTDDGSYAILADGVEMTGDFARELPSAANEGRPQGSYWAPQALVHGKTRHADGTARVKTVRRETSAAGDEFVFDCAGAYAFPKLRALERRIVRDGAANTVTVSDRAMYAEACTFETALVTCEALVKGREKGVWYLQRGNPRRHVKVEVRAQGAGFLPIAESVVTPRRLGFRLDRPLAEARVEIVFSSASEAGMAAELHPDSSGWRPLLAQDLSDAEFAKGTWYRDAEGLLTANKNVNLVTKDEWGPFALDFEYRMSPGANSGVFVYCSDLRNRIPNKMEVAILDDPAKVWRNMHLRPDQQNGAIYSHVSPRARALKKTGEWNRMTITMEGKRVRVLLNGHLVTDTDLAAFTNGDVNPNGVPVPSWHKGFPALATIPTHGKIGLQGLHGAKAVQFKYLKIKEL